MAVGNYEIILTSIDGLIWANSSELGTSNQILSDVVWTGNRFVSFGANGSVALYTSADGLDWVKSDTLNFGQMIWTGSSESGGFDFIAAGNGIYQSQDGVNWTTLNDSISANKIAWNGETFVAMGLNIHSSPDAVNWTQRNSNVSNVTLFDVCWSPSGVVAVGATESILTSPDGISWTQRRRESVYKDLYSVAYGPGVGFVAVGDDSEFPVNGFTTGIFFYSADGVDWTLSTPGLTVARSVIWIEPQGLEKGRFVATGYADTVYISEDGVNWTKSTKGARVIILGMAWTGEQLIAVGQGGAVLSSPDGKKWAVVDSGQNGRALNDVVWTGEQLVAVGNHGLVLTSPDGVNWVQRNSGTYNPLLSVSWSGKWLLATSRDSTNPAAGGKVYASPNGITWWEYATGTNVPLNSNVFTGERFIAVGAKGNILTAPEEEPLGVRSSSEFPLNPISLFIIGEELRFVLNPWNKNHLALQPAQVNIYNVLGKLVQSETKAIKAGQAVLSIGHIPPGPYYFELSVDNKKYAESFSIIR